MSTSLRSRTAAILARRPGLRTSRSTAFRKSLCSDLVGRCHLTVGGTEAMGGAHGLQHGVVDVEALGVDVHDLAGLEAAVGAGDGMEDAGQLPLGIGVSPVTGFGGNGDE